MKKIVMFTLLAVAGLSLASQVRAPFPPAPVAAAMDVPPPSCAPDCDLQGN